MIGIRESLIAVLSMLFGCNVGQSQVVRLSVDFARAEGTWNMPALALGQGGLQSDPMIEPHIKEIRELRPQTIRLFLSEYYRIYPDHDVYDFSRLDRELDAIRATGARPTLSLAMKPPMLFPEVDHFQVHPNNYEEWESLCAALSSHCRAQAYDVAAWEVCNEPDIGESGGTPQFFKTAKDYNTFYDHTVAGIRSRDPLGYEESKWNLFEYVEAMPLVATDPSGNVRSIGGIGCQEVCESAAQNPTLRDSGGTVVCKCNFISTPSVCRWFCEKCACIFEHPDIPIGECPEWEKCGLEHEEGHFPDVTCDPKNRKPGEDWFRAPTVDPTKVKTYECRAKKKEIKCLQNAMAKSSSGRQIRMKYYIGEQERWVDRNCGWFR